MILNTNTDELYRPKWAIKWPKCVSVFDCSSDLPWPKPLDAKRSNSICAVHIFIGNTFGSSSGNATSHAITGISVFGPFGYEKWFS